MSTDLVPVVQQPLPVAVIVERLDTIQELMRKAMSQGIDYGAIPGTAGRPTLLKPGAEKLCVMFRLCPSFETRKTMDGLHMTIESTCTISDLEGRHLGQATAFCSTRESKYAYRKAERVCPECGKANIRKSKQEGGWYCWVKTDGCGAQFGANDERIVSQQTGRVDNPDLPDTYNTVARIAEKRAWIAATRLVTGASALFDEELPEAEHGEAEPAAKSEPSNGHAKPEEPSWKLTDGEMRQVTEWSNKLATATPADVNLWRPNFKKLSQPVRNVLAPKIETHAATMGWVWDEKSCTYSDPKAAASRSSAR